MTKEGIQNYAEQLSKQYNPDGLSPYPFENIQKDKQDLKILLTEKLPDSVSGIIGFFPKKSNTFIILINKIKPVTRRNFTIAHELGHYLVYLKYNGEPHIHFAYNEYNIHIEWSFMKSRKI